MAVDPLAIDPVDAPVDPGFFDGQMPAEIPADPAQPTQVAGATTKILQQILRPRPADAKRLDEVVNEPATSGVVGDYTIIREATPDEVWDFTTLTGKTHGKPSPTTAERLEGIPAAEFNLETIDGPDALKATVDKVSEIWKDAAHRAGRDVMSWEDTKQLANEMGMEETVERLMRRKIGDTMNAEQITSSLQAIATSAMELNRLAKVAANSTDAADLLKFRQHLAFHAALQTGMKGAQMEAARALQSFRIPRGVGPDVDAQALTDLMNDFGGDKSIRDMAKSYMALPTQAQRNKFSYSAWDKIKGSWFEIWINGLLSAPQTHLVNMTGNTIFQMFQLPERFGAGLIGAARRAAGSTRETVYLQETVSDAIGAIQGFGDGLRLAAEAWRTEAPVRDVVSKIESAQRRMITSENLRPDGSDFMRTAIDYIGALIRLAGRALMTEDEFFKAIAYRRQLNALATRRAMEMRRNGATSDDIAAEMENVLSGKDADIRTDAENFAQYATFTNPVQGLTGKVGAAIQGTVIGRMLLPFFKTPVNIFKAAAERSPYGFIKAIRAAKGPEKDILLARASLGSSVMAWAGYQYIGGSITGSGPTDSTLRRQMEELGWQKWSFVSAKEGVEKPRWIQIGHTFIRHPEDVDYVSYARLEPASMILAVAADVAERMRWPTATQVEIDDIGMSALDTVFDYMKDQTFMRGIANIADLASMREASFRNTKVSRLVQDLVGSQVPYSSLLGGIERVMDPSQENIIPDRDEPIGLRDLYAGLAKLESRVPLTDFSKNPPLRDRFGNKRLQKGAKVIEMILPPFFSDVLGDDIKKIEADPVLLEVARAGVPLRMPERKIDGVPLTAEEYDAFILFASNPPGDIPTFYDALKQTVSGKAFKNAPAPDRQILIQGVDADYKAIAKSLLLDAPEYAERFARLRAEVEQHREIIEAVGRQIQ